jgi:hypothetical protein
MKTMVGIFDTHKDAEYAIRKIHKRGIPLSHLSMMDDSVPVLRNYEKEEAKSALGLIVGLIIGPLAGILIGLRIIYIPGLSFIYDGGALVGALAGMSVGIALGGIASIIIAMNQEREGRANLNTPHKTMVLVDGDKKEIEQVEHILHEEEIAA